MDNLDQFRGTLQMDKMLINFGAIYRAVCQEQPEWDKADDIPYHEWAADMYQAFEGYLSGESTLERVSNMKYMWSYVRTLPQFNPTDSMMQNRVHTDIQYILDRVQECEDYDTIATLLDTCEPGVGFSKANQICVDEFLAKYSWKELMNNAVRMEKLVESMLDSLSCSRKSLTRVEGGENIEDGYELWEDRFGRVYNIWVWRDFTDLMDKLID